MSIKSLSKSASPIIKSLSKSASPVVKSLQNIPNTIIKSIQQKNHSLKADLIVILVIILTIIILQKLYYYYKNSSVVEGQKNLLDKSEQRHIEKKCNESNKSKVCNGLTKRGLKECSKYPCCAWVKYEKGAKCVSGNESGPMITSSKDKFDEYYYMGKKHKNIN